MLNAFDYDRKKSKITSADVLHLLLRLFLTSNSAVLLMGTQKQFLFQGTGYPSYTTPLPLPPEMFKYHVTVL